MTTAAARVETKIVIGADDQASKKIAKVQGELARANAKLREAADSSTDFGKSFSKAGDEAAGRAGKLSTALSSLGDFAGRSEGAFRSASEAAGAFDDVLTLLPGPIGLAGAAAAGLTTVLVLQAQAAQQAEARLKQAFSGQVLNDIRALRNEFDLSAEASVSLGQALIESGKSASDVQDDLRAVVAKAKEVGDDGSKAVEEFAKSLSSSASESDKLKNKLRALGIEMQTISLSAAVAGTALAGLGSDADKEAAAGFSKFAKELEGAKKKLADLEAGHRGPLAALREHQSLTAKLGAAFDSSSRYAKAEASATKAQAEAVAAARKEVEAITGKIRDRQNRVISLQAALVDAAKVERQIAVEDAAREAEDAKAANAELARKKRQEAASRALAAARRAEAEAAKQAAYGLRQNEAGARALLDYQRQDLETLDLLARARRATATSVEAQVAAERKLIGIQTQRQVLETENTAGLDTADKQKRIRAIQDLADAELRTRIKSIKDNAAAVVKAQADARKKEADAARARIGESASYVGQVAGSLDGDFAKAASSAAGAVQKISGSWEGLANSAPDAISAVGGIANAFVDGEREKATILAITEGAAALASIATGNYPSAAAHGASAALYGLAAGGVIGGATGKTPSVGGSSGGGTSSGGFTPSTPSGNQSNGSSGGNTYLFVGVTATKHQLAKQIKRDQRSLVGTGL
ncbi:MAG: hypothetical protein H6747_09590 [Deltaproteobacteria bacterium]|nr:hypothetical protein [Deltaproteobacteria bacterium]